MIDYIDVLASKYPNVAASCVGDSTVYTNLVWESGDPLPTQADLDTAAYTSIRDDMWVLIKAERDMRKTGGVQVGAYWFHSDDGSRIQQIGLVMMGANMPANIQWKTMTGEFVTMTPTLATSIFNTTASSDQTIFQIAEQHRTSMIASADPATYNYETGWPAVFSDM